MQLDCVYESLSAMLDASIPFLHCNHHQGKCNELRYYIFCAAAAATVILVKEDYSPDRSRI